MNATNTSSFNVYYSKIVSFPKVGVKQLKKLTSSHDLIMSYGVSAAQLTLLVLAK